MLLFPGLDVGHGQKIIGIGRALGRNVDDDGGRNEFLGVDRVDGVARQILAADPMDRRVKVRACVFADGKVGPIPGDTLLVVFRNDVAFESGGFAW